MTDQFSYLKHRMDHIESRVNRLEKIFKFASGDDAESADSSGPDWHGDRKSAVPDGDLRMIEATLWSIFELVSSQSTGRTNDYKDFLDIKDAVSETRDGVQTVIGLLAKTG